MAKNQGGASQPVHVVTDAELADGTFNLSGKRATPVYGAEQSRKIKGGSSQPVYVVTEAQIQSGEFELIGGRAMPFTDSVTTRPMSGKVAIPVYVVGGTLGLSAPAAPTGLTAVQDGADVDLAWTDSATNETGYRIYRSSDGVAYALLDTIAAGLGAYTDVAPGNGIWYYKVAAYNSAGEALSDAVSIALLDFDFTTMDDGPLPDLFTGATWAIASGVAVNTPTLSAEILPDPGLEATYTGGMCDSLTKVGSPTLAESADVHGGSKAQAFTGATASNRIYFDNLNLGGVNTWHLFSAWAKRVSGTAGNVFINVLQGGAQPADDAYFLISSASYVQYVLSTITTSTGAFFRSPALFTSGTSDAVIVDDGSHKTISYPTLFALLPATRADAVVKIKPAALLNSNATLFGLVLRASAQTNPDNCIFVMARRHEGISTLVKISVVKKIGTTYTRVLNETNTTIVADAWLEVRASGNTVQVFYNDVQRGGDLTISDAELAGTYHGMFDSGGNSMKGFFMLAN